MLGSRALVQAVLEDYRTAEISDRERALFTLLEKVAIAAYEVTQADVDAAKRAGWSDDELYDAITVCSLFQFYNAWIDATGVQDMPSNAYAMSGKRIATQGYAAAPEGPA